MTTASATVMNPQLEQGTLLSDRAIKRHHAQGEVIIEPFDERQLGPNSYDVRLGEYYYRESPDHGIFNPRSKSSVHRTWSGPFRAERAGDWMEQHDTQLEGIHEDERIIWIHPSEPLLAHTQEFIGSRQKVASSMQARSSAGRSMLEVCSCAGLGDVGYFNRYTMEVTNKSRSKSIPLVVGMRIAQIVFQETEGSDRCYSTKGKYQTSNDLTTVMQNWEPSMMLPRMYDDWELKLPVNERPGSLVTSSTAVAP